MWNIVTDAVGVRLNNHIHPKEDIVMSNKNDINDKFGAMILGAAAISGIATGSFGIALFVGIGLGAAAVYTGAIRF